MGKHRAQSARAYKKTQTASQANRENQLMEYLPLVKYIAGRIAIGLPKSVELDDLINAGVVGLIEAYNNFDASKGVKFESYASMRIRGAILDELRAVDWAPRSTRAKSREMENQSLPYFASTPRRCNRSTPTACWSRIDPRLKRECRARTWVCGDLASLLNGWT